jgi:hypothetical protein
MAKDHPFDASGSDRCGKTIKMDYKDVDNGEETDQLIEDNQAKLS